MKSYIDLISSNTSFRTLWIVNLITWFGSWFATIGVYTLLIDLGASATILAIAAAFHWLPGALQAPITGVILDKSDPKKLIFILLLLESILTFTYLLINSAELIWLFLLLIFVRMGCSSFTFTAFQTVIPKIIDSENLRYANDISSLTWSVSFIVGMVLGAIVVEFFGVKVSFIIDGFLLIASLLLITKIDLPISLIDKNHKGILLLKDGVIYLKNNIKIFHFIVLHSCVALTAFDALVALLAKDLYANTISEPIAMGSINAIRAIGLFIGPFIFLKIKDEKKLISFLLIGEGFGILLWAFFQWNFYLSFAGVFLTGLFTTSLWSVTYSLIQKNTKKEFYGRVVAYNDMIFLFTSAFVSFFIGIMAENKIELWVITAILGLLYFIFAAYHYLIKKVIY